MEATIVQVLVIDRDRAFLGAMRAPLERDGFTVLATDDGLSGLALAESGAFDLVLLNVKPTGQDICRQMRQFSNVPLIMFGSSEPADIVSSLAAGADDYVLHPSSPRELLARVHAVLRRAEWQRQRSGQAAASTDSQQTLGAFSRNSQPGVVS